MPKNMTFDGIHLYDEAYGPWSKALKQYMVKGE